MNLRPQLIKVYEELQALVSQAVTDPSGLAGEVVPNITKYIISDLRMIAGQLGYHDLRDIIK